MSPIDRLAERFSSAAVLAAVLGLYRSTLAGPACAPAVSSEPPAAA